MNLKKIKNLNILSFRNFEGVGVDELNYLNIFFGWNGTGKSAISKSLRLLQKSDDDFEGSFKITTESGSVTDENAGEYENKIKVFNKGYVEDIFRSDKNVQSVFYAGETGVDIADKLEELESLKSQRDALPECNDESEKIALSVRDLVNKLLRGHKKEFTDTDYGKYDRRDFKNRIELLKDKYLSEFLMNPEEEKEMLSRIQNEARNQKDIKILDGALNWVEENLKQVKHILFQRNPAFQESKNINNLDDDQKDWVEEGRSLHFGEGHDKEKCLFCNSNISQDRKIEIINHFTNDLMELKKECGLKIEKIEEHSLQITTCKESSNPAIKKLHKDIDSVLLVLKKALSSKREKSDKKDFDIDINHEDLREAFKSTKQGLSQSDKAAQKLERHFVARRYEEYLLSEENFKYCEKAKDGFDGMIEGKEDEIRKLEKDAKYTQKPIDEINAVLKRTFPEKKLTVDNKPGKDNDDPEYQILRDSSPCDFSSLSEGEKNVIALTYFMVSLKDKDFSDDGVVVIDDPASSLDKNSIFSIFGLITSAIRHTRETDENSWQYLIFTHNLDLLEHLKEEFRNQIHKEEGYINLYYIKFDGENGSRVDGLPGLLKNYKSDYFYLFDQLKIIKEKSSDEFNLADGYPAANFLRRWLESYLGFVYADDGNYKQKLERAYKDGFDGDSSKDYLKMYRFTNHGSHENEKSVPAPIDHSLLENTQEFIREALDLCEELTDIHYQSLQDL